MDTIKKILVICDNRLEAIRKFNSFRKIASENYCPLYSMLSRRDMNMDIIKVYNNVTHRQIYQIEFISSECMGSLHGYSAAFVVDTTENPYVPHIVYHVMGPDTRKISYSELLNHFTSSSKYSLNYLYGLSASPWFIDDVDSKSLPYLVWHHSGNTLGHATMETRDDGVYANCSLNDSLDAFSYAIERLGMQPSNLQIKKVIFNDPATIVYWEDGTKTVVKAMDGETFDKEKGLAMTISKKV